MDNALNGAGAVDLASLREEARQREMLDEQRDTLTDQLLVQAGLRCQCGERIRGQAVQYFAVVDGPVQSAGGEHGINLIFWTCCSRTCPQALLCEEHAIARRDGAGGRVTWLDERRAARVKRNQG